MDTLTTCLIRVPMPPTREAQELVEQYVMVAPRGRGGSDTRGGRCGS